MSVETSGHSSHRAAGCPLEKSAVQWSACALRSPAPDPRYRHQFPAGTGTQRRLVGAVGAERAFWLSVTVPPNPRPAPWAARAFFKWSLPLPSVT
jgi:hypothetical protein